MTCRRRGSLIIKTKRKLLPLEDASSTSEWSTMGQHTFSGRTTTVGVLRQDWSEDDSEEEYDSSPPEKLRESVLHHPGHLPPAILAGDHHLQPGKSPAVESLGDLLGIKTGKYRLLHSSEESYTSSSEEITMSLPSKMSSVMTSTMMLGNKVKKQAMCLEDLSAIKSRESLDPGQSDMNRDLPCSKAGGVHRKIEVKERSQFKPVSSTPARSDRSKVPLGQSGESFDLSSIHSSEAGGSMLVPRVLREMITEEMVEESEADSEDENWNLNLTDEDPEKQKELTIKTTSPSPPRTQSPLTIMIPETESDSEAVPVSDHPDTSPHLTELPDNLSLTIQAELSQLSPPSHRSKLSSSDTSGEIFSAVVHSTQVTVVVPCHPVSKDTVSMVNRVRKRFRLATRQMEPAMTIFSQAEYYRGKQSSEWKFDELVQGEVEEEVFSQ